MKKIEFDEMTRVSLKKEIFQKLPLIRKYLLQDSYFQIVVDFLQQIHNQPEDRILDALSFTQEKVVKQYGQKINGENPSLYYSSIMWEYMYLVAYYIHKKENNLLWLQKLLPHMKSLQSRPQVVNEYPKGEELVNLYIEKRADLLKTKQHINASITPPEKKQTAAENIQSNTCQRNIPDIVQIMQDINNGNIRYIDVDWELQIKTMLKLCSLMPTKFPYVIWLWGLLGEIDEINTRIDILHKMQEVATKCFDDLFQASDFIKDCDCIIYVYQGSLQYNTKNIGLRHRWTDDKKHLNDLAHILCKEMVDPKFMVAIAEEMYQASQGDRKQAMLTLVLRANRNMGHVSMDNIIDFAKNLYIAEGFRHLILSGEEDYRDIPPLAEFEPKLLKACFEEYIRLRNLEIKDIIEQDLTHCGDAEELECLEYLLKEESQHVNRENMLEDFRGSAAYNAMWYPGRQKVLDMINVFVKYLNNKIKKIKKEEARLGIRDNIQNFNVQGDYIAGDKHVGTHIDNVESGGIGTQTTKE